MIQYSSTNKEIPQELLVESLAYLSVQSPENNLRKLDKCRTKVLISSDKSQHLFPVFLANVSM